MKPLLSVAATLAAVLVAAPALAQSAPERSADDITRELNGGPPDAAAPRPAAPTPVDPAPATRTPVEQPATVASPAEAPAPITAPAPLPPAATPATVSTPVAVVSEPVAPEPPPADTVLDAAAVAALPFSVDLPAGFRITTGRPGPDFRVYAIRRGTTPFVMVYVGDHAMFPIYEGEMVEASGRASVLIQEDDRRRAVEHLFQRERRGSAPSQVHVWRASVPTAHDRDVAEAIAQSVDVR